MVQPVLNGKLELDNVPPVHTIPPEILSTIFLDLKRRRRSRYHIPFEVSMTHVCRRWRNTALSTPLLWDSVNIYSAKSLDYVQSYLTRSQTCPIDLRIDIWQSHRFLNSKEAVATITPLISLVSEHADRWRTLLVFSTRRKITDAILSQMRDLTAPLLERVRIIDDGEVDDPDNFLPHGQTFDPRILTGGVPKLDVVYTNNLHYPPPITNITTLHLRARSPFSSFEINNEALYELAACPYLSTLSIHGEFSGNWAFKDVTMPNLRSVWFRSNDTFAGRFLSTVNVPNIESLWLHCPHYHVVETILNHHPRPCFPSLKYLTLQQFDYYPSSKISQVFTSIEALHLPYGNNFHVSFLKQTLVEDEPIRWPKLHTLVFRTTRETHAAKFSSVLDELVTERQRAGRPLARLLLDPDALAALSTADSVRAHTSLEELRPDNFDDPWWIIAHTDTADQI